MVAKLRAMKMIYRAAYTTGSSKYVAIVGWIKPISVTISPTGNVNDTINNVSKFVIGAISETYPKCIIASGIVNINAPMVVAKLDVPYSIIVFGTAFFIILLLCKELLIFLLIRVVNKIIPSVAENDNCNPTDAQEYGFMISKSNNAVNSDVKLSLSLRKNGEQISNICIIPARDTAGVNPLIAINRNRTGIP